MTDDIRAYGLGEDGDQWMVEGTLDPDAALRAVRALWEEQGVTSDNEELLDEGYYLKTKASTFWWWEPVNPDYPDDDATLRDWQTYPGPTFTSTFPGVLVTTAWTGAPGEPTGEVKKPRGTATGMPATMLGYWIGRILCKIGIHDVITYRQHGYGPRGDFIASTCVRYCDWADDRWER